MVDWFRFEAGSLGWSRGSTGAAGNYGSSREPQAWQLGGCGFLALGSVQCFKFGGIIRY